MIKKISIFILMASLCGCQRQCQSINRNAQTSPRHYNVIMYSGGVPVFTDTFYGLINNNAHSDGCYYYKGEELIEISGDYKLNSTK